MSEWAVELGEEGPEFHTFYQGHLWDAPFTDDALPKDLSGNTCDYCSEDITENDDAFQGPHILGHLECHLRGALGDVQHLEDRCSCFGRSEKPLPSDEHLNYRSEARATMRWLLEHNRGRFRP